MIRVSFFLIEKRDSYLQNDGFVMDLDFQSDFVMGLHMEFTNMEFAGIRLGSVPM